jgi:uncharacterized repeat protein (TIGR03803 family)
LHSFKGPLYDGAYPVAALVDVNGTLYGTTSAGGDYYELGTIFSITTGGKEKVLHGFGSGTDGANPQARLIDVNGKVYGTTAYGGAYGQGTVFPLTPFRRFARGARLGGRRFERPWLLSRPDRA